MSTVIVWMPTLNLELLERQAILYALQISGYRQDKAAQLLGISSRVLNYKIKNHDITYHKWRVNHGKSTRPESTSQGQAGHDGDPSGLD